MAGNIEATLCAFKDLAPADRDAYAQVCATSRARAGAPKPAKHSFEDITKAAKDVFQVNAVHVVPGTAQARFAVLVVQGSFFIVAENTVGLACSAEDPFRFLVVRVLVWVIGQSDFSISLFDGARIGVARHT